MPSASALGFIFPWATFCAPSSHGVLPLRRLAHTAPRVASAPADEVTMGGGVYPQAVYWTYLEVGTPPVQAPVIFDTGSPFLNVEAVGCEGCLHTPPNAPYDPSTSSTSRPYTATPSAWSRENGVADAAGSHEPDTWDVAYKTCDARHPMESCTMGGRLFTDKVSLAGFGPVDVVLGTIDEQSSNINPLQEVTGLMGIMPPSPKYANRHVFTQLVAAGACRSIFGMCLNDGATSHGTLTVGGVDQRLASGPIEYVPDLRPDITTGPRFGVHVARIDLDGFELAWNGTGLLDSGTNILILPSALFAQARDAMCGHPFRPHCESLWRGECAAMSDREIDEYPTLQFGLDGTTIAMSSRDYLLLGSPLADTEDQRCLGISDGGALFLFGDTTFRNYYVVHDLERQRIGWGRVNRETCGSLDAGHVPPVVAVFV